MMKRFLGIISLLYFLLIIYIWVFDKVNIFLAPQMGIYLKISIPILFIISIVLLFNNKVSYRFKISDLILLLPIIMILFIGDGKLSFKFIGNRMNNFSNPAKSNNNNNQKEEVDIEKPKTIEIEEEIDFTEVDIDVIDPVYIELANYITFMEKAIKYENNTIRVKGFISKNKEYVPSNYFAIGKIEMSCCAADTSFVGFLGKYKEELEENSWYEIEGVLKKGQYLDNTNIMFIDVKNVKAIDSSKENEYVYPCYAYDNGECKESLKYEFEY